MSNNLLNECNRVFQELETKKLQRDILIDETRVLSAKLNEQLMLLTKKEFIEFGILAGYIEQ